MRTQLANLRSARSLEEHGFRLSVVAGSSGLQASAMLGSCTALGIKSGN